MVSPSTVVAATMSASDPNFFAQRRMARLQNGLAAKVILDFRPKLGNRCKLFPVYTLFRSSILDFRAKLGNRCKLFPVYTLFRASILDFKPRLGNRCSAIAATVRNGPPAACRG